MCQLGQLRRTPPGTAGGSNSGMSSLPSGGAVVSRSMSDINTSSSSSMYRVSRSTIGTRRSAGRSSSVCSLPSGGAMVTRSILAVARRENLRSRDVLYDLRSLPSASMRVRLGERLSLKPSCSKSLAC